MWVQGNNRDCALVFWGFFLVRSAHQGWVVVIGLARSIRLLRIVCGIVRTVGT